MFSGDKTTTDSRFSVAMTDFTSIHMDDSNEPASDTEWALVEPFETENGALSHVSREECFALGVEWAMFRDRLKSGKPFTTYCLENNAARIAKMAERHQRFVEYHSATVDGWALITVGNYRV